MFVLRRNVTEICTFHSSKLSIRHGRAKIKVMTWTTAFKQAMSTTAERLLSAFEKRQLSSSGKEPADFPRVGCQATVFHEANSKASGQLAAAARQNIETLQTAWKRVNVDDLSKEMRNILRQNRLTTSPVALFRTLMAWRSRCRKPSRKRQN